MNANGSFNGQQAPCGQLVDGENYEDHDDECVVTRDVEFACGCVSIHHAVPRRKRQPESRPARRHVLIDELLSAE